MNHIPFELAQMHRDELLRLASERRPVSRAAAAYASRPEGERVDGFDPKTSFGYETSKRYVAREARGDEDETVAFLARVARDPHAVEFAVGSGRIALPLMRAGVRVDGIEQSQDMVERLREKPDGERVHVVVGDMTRVDMGRKYGLVYLVYNTIGNLLTQEEQVRCFENASRHLTDDGVFVLECRVPSAPTRTERQFVEAERIAVDQVTLHVARYDPVTQLLDANHVHIGEDGVAFGPISLRLAHPPEFDLMARIAGLRLSRRVGGWHDEPFTATSWRHVSVYEPALGDGPC